MGCNSHLSIEVQGRWEHAPNAWETWALDIPEDRYYQLYEAMAGVRGDEDKAVVSPRGIPSDVSLPVKHWINRAGMDGHTHSWLYPSEFHTALKQIGTENENGVWGAVCKVLVALSVVYGDRGVRLVFFFDN